MISIKRISRPGGWLHFIALPITPAPRGPRWETSRRDVKSARKGAARVVVQYPKRATFGLPESCWLWKTFRWISDTSPAFGYNRNSSRKLIEEFWTMADMVDPKHGSYAMIPSHWDQLGPLGQSKETLLWYPHQMAMETMGVPTCSDRTQLLFIFPIGMVWNSEFCSSSRKKNSLRWEKTSSYHQFLFFCVPCTSAADRAACAILFGSCEEHGRLWPSRKKEEGPGWIKLSFSSTTWKLEARQILDSWGCSCRWFVLRKPGSTIRRWSGWLNLCGSVNPQHLVGDKLNPWQVSKWVESAARSSIWGGHNADEIDPWGHGRGNHRYPEIFLGASLVSCGFPYEW